MSATDPIIGVLALQGDVREHLIALAGLGVTARPIRRPSELDGIDGIVVPGGESTTICRLLDVFELREPLSQRLAEGLPAFGSCAGMIVLASTILDGRADQIPLGAIDIVVRRNAFGRQVDSFETDLEVAGVPGGPVRGVFIRAPWVERTGPAVRVLARVGEHPVAVRQGRVLATSFHPEVSGDDRLHALFLGLVTTPGQSAPSGLGT
jgi:5'-phosphate synthase pdxT subunit